MRRVQEILQLSTEHLETHGVDGARRQAEEVVAGALQMKRMDLYLNFERPLTDEELERCREWLKRRAMGEPVAYIEGEVEFGGCIIGVDRRVLIPRPETELLLEMVPERGVIWDLCTGSGCLAIALKKKFANSKVIGSDLSGEALELARENGRRNGVEIDFRQGDLGECVEELVDLVVCNPPYIREDEMAGLDLDFEPREALVGGVRGTEFYERCAVELRGKVRAGGKIFFEIGESQGESVPALFAEWGSVRMERDWAGKPRFVIVDVA